ncbi:DUF2157 domain-containing protein [Dawidia soli]|uniref:DUF2157 domain-containing protein n=1 Tax=Dawidia soli TaxID=2782352 RepID=A0AAP2DAS6_9BACT|nr:DUF2157 domain-containing protein [Dawidia soli]MBT1687490.1 DUF2157 domain-containing protein [Dawidia soli]
MSKFFVKELAELEQASIITPDTAERIRAYYAQKPGLAANRLVIVFGILGALLTGLGVILIIAHNWDVLGKVPKLALALLPLLLGQAACAFTLIKKAESTAWREGAATFLFLSIGAAIAIVSQVYQIDGSLGGFLLIWMLLAFPIQYILRSSVASLLLLGGITWYACDIAYFDRSNGVAWWYLALLVLSFPYYYRLYRDHSGSNFFAFHAWLLPLSLLCALGMFNHLFSTTADEELTALLYINLMSLLVLVGHFEKLRQRRLIVNGFLVCGSLGTIGMLLFFTFEDFWESVSRLGMAETLDVRVAAPYWISLLLTLALLVYMLYRYRGTAINAKVSAFAVVLALFLLGFTQPDVSRILANVAVFVFGVFTIRDGAQQNKLSILNYGLLIVALLIVCRFFDTDMSFIARGLLFIAVGVGFFVANLRVLRNRRNA